MTTRADVVRWALTQNGRFDGVGYPGHNTYSPDLGRPQEFWCGDFVTDAFKQTGDPLRSMQPGCKTGFAYCPDAVNWARANGAAKRSWEAQPGDIALFDWNGDGVADHTELVERWANSEFWTVGGDSGPSNVDHFHGQGGVHRHVKSAPTGVGHPQVLLVIDGSKGAMHGFGAAPVPPKPVAPISNITLMLKSPMMHGVLVSAAQSALNHRGVYVAIDGVYGPKTREAVMLFQHRHGLITDGIVGPKTHQALGV